MLPLHYHLAQINVARMMAPLDDPLMEEFVAQLPVVNALADGSPGFVWRLQDATGVRPFEDPFMLINVSVWESIDALKEFTYRSGHRGPLGERTKWFERPAQAHLACWWIPAGHVPSVEEAVERLEFLRVHGETPAAFSLSKAQPAPDQPSAVPMPLNVDLDQKVFVSAANTSNGDADGRTGFRYRQSGGRVWATYGGGRVRFGSLVAVGDGEGRLDMRYQHVAPDGTVRTGTCIARPEILPDGRIRLHEEWQWTNGDRSSGKSIVEEVGRSA